MQVYPPHAHVRGLFATVQFYLDDQNHGRPQDFKCGGNRRIPLRRVVHLHPYHQPTACRAQLLHLFPDCRSEDLRRCYLGVRRCSSVLLVLQDHSFFDQEVERKKQRKEQGGVMGSNARGWGARQGKRALISRIIKPPKRYCISLYYHN